MKRVILDNSTMEIDFDQTFENNCGQLNIEVHLPDEIFLNRESQLVKLIDFVADLPAMLQAARLQCCRIFPQISYSPVRMKYLCSLTVCFIDNSGDCSSAEKIEKICRNLIKHWHSSLCR